MKRYSVAQIGYHPIAETLRFVGVVILAGDHQIGDLKPNIRFTLQPFERVQNWIEVGESELVIEPLREGFEIDVGSIDMPKHFWPSFRRNVPGSNHDAF